MRIDIVAYAAHVWWVKIKQRTTIKKLTNIQRTVCEEKASAMATTPRVALESFEIFRHYFNKREAKMADRVDKS